MLGHHHDARKRRLRQRMFHGKAPKKDQGCSVWGNADMRPEQPEYSSTKGSLTSVTRLAANSKWETEMYHMHECNVLDIPNLNAGLLDQAKTSDS